jgi:hypothetical protein
MTRRMSEAQATEALTRALITAASQGKRPRCSDGEASWMFLDENDQIRKIAATYCAGCFVWEECDQVGRHQRFGTWASRDRTQRPCQKLKPDSEVAA